jgi:signal transduction histidine kinase
MPPTGGPVDLLIAATAEREGLIVLCDDRDFQMVASVTGQPVKLEPGAAAAAGHRDAAGLVSLMLDLRTVQAVVPPGLAELEGGLSRFAERVAGVFDHARELSHGIHPAILSERGLQAALKTLARRSAVPVELDLHTARRLTDPVEVAAYYAVSEALTNTAKHARASVVQVELDAPDATLRLAIRDDGIGGADPAQGSGLTGLRDRIEAVGGTLDVTSPAGGGTTLLIKIPV